MTTTNLITSSNPDQNTLRELNSLPEWMPTSLGEVHALSNKRPRDPRDMTTLIAQAAIAKKRKLETGSANTTSTPIPAIIVNPIEATNNNRIAQSYTQQLYHLFDPIDMLNEDPKSTGYEKVFYDLYDLGHNVVHMIPTYSSADLKDYQMTTRKLKKSSPDFMPTSLGEIFAFSNERPNQTFTIETTCMQIELTKKTNFEDEKRQLEAEREKIREQEYEAEIYNDNYTSFDSQLSIESSYNPIDSQLSIESMFEAPPGDFGF